MSRKGFTLVELMVVISIIAVLSTIAFSTFSNAQKASRDAKRRGDIDAVANALEANKTSSGYINVVDSQFASGKVPIDPMQTSFNDYGSTTGKCGNTDSTDNYEKRCWYCKNNNTSASVKTAASYCTTADWGVGDNNWGSGVTSWYICANLETGSTKYYCRKSQQ
jgi:prepilin-type N-terminal cleavage/methylation domain-containing protein